MTNNLSAAKEKSRIDVLFETPNPSILAAAASYYISFFPSFFALRNAICPIVKWRRIGFRTGFSYYEGVR